MIDRTTMAACVVGVGFAASIGVGIDHLYGVAIGLLTLLPVAAHARHVGVRNVLSEPSAITVIVVFYLLVFPLRGLVVALNGYTDLDVIRATVTQSDLVSELLLASASTTILVEAYYFMNRGRAARPAIRAARPGSNETVVTLTYVLLGISILALLTAIAQYGGIAGARAELLAHSKAAALAGSSSVAGSAWDLFAPPAIWCCAYSVLQGNLSRRSRLVLCGAAVLVLAGAVLIFGSRLDALLGLIGGWIIFLYSGKRLPARVILVALPLALILSQPLLNARTDGANTRLSTWERYSRTAGYGILDVSLAVRAAPQEIRAEDKSATRWLDLPAYFVPSKLWPGRPNLATRRLDVYVASDIGSQGDKNTGFPTTFITEGWLLGGVPGALVLSALFGAALGSLSRRLTRRVSITPLSLLAYAFLVTVAWTYYKDGDILSTFVGQAHTAVYLLLAFWVVQALTARRVRQSASVAPVGHSQSVLARRDAERVAPHAA